MKPWNGILAVVLAATLLTPTDGAAAPARHGAAARHSHSSSDPSVVVEWNQIGVQTIAADNAAVPPRKAPIEVYLYLGFMHAAVYNAVVGIEGGYRPYRFHAEAPRHASAEAAAVAAAHRILVNYSPEQQATLDAAYVASLAEIPDGRAEQRGIRYGERAANRIIALREDDGRYDADVQFTKPPGPGVWVPTPPAFAPFQAPWLGFVDPLLGRRGASFDPGRPPALTSDRYSRDFNEVKAKGSIDPAARTPAENETALFYAGNPVVQFTRGLYDQVVVRDLDLVGAARMFAAVHMSLADASIAVWYSKFKYGLWRPITAIHQADQDGNPATTADPAWNSVIPSPPYPAYVSGYNGVMGAYTQALQDTFGTRRLRLTLTTTALLNGQPIAPRVYEFGWQARRDCIDGRVWLGIHFRFDDTVAARMGRRVAASGLDHFFQPTRHHDD